MSSEFMMNATMAGLPDPYNKQESRGGLTN